MMWDNLSNEEKETVLKYLELLDKFKKNPSDLTMDQKKWVLQNCDCKTELVPVEIHNKYVF